VLIIKPIKAVKNRSPLSRTARFRSLALTFLALATCAPAAVTPVAWYRLGENDPGAAPGQAVTGTTRDLLGVNPLIAFGSPLYTNQASPLVAGRIGSSLAVLFNGASQMYSDAVVTTARNNFGLEAWVALKPGVSGTHLIAHNGDTTANGWGLFVDVVRAGPTTYRAEFGGGVTVGAVGGPGSGERSVWVHVALVRDSGTSTLYVNGVAYGSTSLTPATPTGGFAIAATPQSPHTAFFPGAIDEVRVFTFSPGQFSTADLLVNQQLPATLTVIVVVAPRRADRAASVIDDGARGDAHKTVGAVVAVEPVAFGA
jgi:hypothetical protein